VLRQNGRRAGPESVWLCVGWGGSSWGGVEVIPHFTHNSNWKEIPRSEPSERSGRATALNRGYDNKKMSVVCGVL